MRAAAAAWHLDGEPTGTIFRIQGATWPAARAESGPGRSGAVSGQFKFFLYTVGDTVLGRTVLKLNSGRLGGWLEGEARRSATGKVAHS